jgi:eukaryotic-like serine/threonine-protein kinase
LEGLTLPGGWKIGNKYVRTDGLSAGRYSIGYFVERNGQKGFLKAIDYSRAAKSPDIPKAMLELTQAFQFERDVLNQCANHHMDRVISPRDQGEVTVDTSILGRVNYLIFDLADGDVRNTLAAIETSEIVWRLRALHHITTGLCQLHGAGIAHQDVKPSNVLTFGQISKVADLGSVSINSGMGPRDAEPCKGDKAYAPPELLYGQINPEFNVRRFGCDCYLLGSLVVFFFSGVGMTCSILSHLAPELHPKVWSGTYKEVLPYVQDAFGKSVGDFAQEIDITSLGSELVEIVRHLCQPDPLQRGHPTARAGPFGNPYSLERYRTQFDLLASRAALGRYSREGNAHRN